MSSTAVQKFVLNGPRTALYTDTLTGPSQSGVVKFTPLIPSGVTVAEVILTAVVTTAGGGAEAANDTYVYKTNVAWNSSSGTLTQVPQTEQTPAVFATSGSPISGCTFGASTSGAQCELTYGTGTGLDAGTVVAISVAVREEGVGVG
jgi:hypothetical protein